MWKRAKSTLIIVVTQLANASLLPENASTWLDDVKPEAINKGVHVQFCTRNARIETVCHQAEDECEPVFRIVA